MIAIIDYDAGNLKSVLKALEYLSQDAMITRNKDEILKADKVILPGVGSFGEAMEKLHKYQLVDVIKEVVSNKTPLLGICLGLQLLFERSDESKGVNGLGVLEGEILRIPNKEGIKIPHMGWNSLDINPESKLYRGIENNSYVYFVHSYYLKAKNEQEVVATTDYSTLIHASVEKDNIFACQFHPEKSGDVGLKILENFANLKKEEL
ncbi:imidazole glycerol phosphate synthase subunit HisH [Anaeromicropila herbilytica]|uniref:Imidazole glycerol phosphate synthase subunit HisH n=1 Tax=Anaeromicropila herbilytica TaxID=2785025 RepID=A0A7R7EKI1_9FIRM|nr:imidazole glycerol phosphate synthase subunit HisH [Anaeromicropila herbilytica]BCN30447.1 imidazole glycerol phosphate synthase subunit HisH [Anaeromicropila herbilytica]